MTLYEQKITISTLNNVLSDISGKIPPNGNTERYETLALVQKVICETIQDIKNTKCSKPKSGVNWI